MAGASRFGPLSSGCGWCRSRDFPRKAASRSSGPLRKQERRRKTTTCRQLSSLSVRSRDFGFSFFSVTLGLPRGTRHQSAEAGQILWILFAHRCRARLLSHSTIGHSSPMVGFAGILFSRTTSMPWLANPLISLPFALRSSARCRTVPCRHPGRVTSESARSFLPSPFPPVRSS